MADFSSFDEFREQIHNPDAKRDREPIQAEQAEQLKRRRKKKASRRRQKSHTLRNYVCMTLGVAAVVCGIFLFFPVPFGSIRIVGNEKVTREDIIFDCGIGEPINILQLSASEMKEKLERDVRIKSVQIDRNLFEIRISVSERKPIAIVQEEMGFSFLDSEGVVVQTAESIRGVDLPIITGLKLNNLLLGDRVEKGAVKIALGFLNNLSPVGADLFSELNMGNEENFVAYTRDGIAVRLGAGDNIAERAKLAERIVGDVKARGLVVEYIDAGITAPYIKMKS